jgi:hypothetical protein
MLSAERVDPVPSPAYFPPALLARERVAQSAEHLTFNQRVAGSNPAALTTLENKRNLADDWGFQGFFFPAERATKPLPAQQ